MKLFELAKEYRISGEMCRKRAKELNKIIKNRRLNESEKLMLRRRITILSAMARETIETANKLADYYGRSNKKDD